MNAVRDDLLILEYSMYFVRAAQQKQDDGAPTDYSAHRRKKKRAELKPEDLVL